MNLQKLRDVIAAEPELIARKIIRDGKCCALGAAMRAAGVDLTPWDTLSMSDDPWEGAKALLLAAYALSQYEGSVLQRLPIINDGLHGGYVELVQDGVRELVWIDNPLSDYDRETLSPKERVLKYIDQLLAEAANAGTITG